MAKINLTLECETEQEARTYLNANEYAAVMWDFDQYLRSIYKYGTIENLNRAANESEMDLAEHLREALRNLLSDRGISLDP